jgi:F-type H+-transporting ATPase subunit a
VPRLGCLGKIIIGVVVILALVIVSALFFPAPNATEHFVVEGEQVGGLHIGPVPITNTLLASFLTIAALVALFFAATRRMKLVPKGLQNAVEMVYELLHNFVAGVAGEKNARRFFPVVATIFLYVIMAAFLSLLPGFDTIGYGSTETYKGAFLGNTTGFVVITPLLKKANTDINFPLALALSSFVFVEFMGISALGFRRYGSRFISVGPFSRSLGQLFRGHIRTGISGLFTGFIEIFTGALEAVSEFVRIVSFTFRLFGNMTAGMVLLLIVMFLIPWVVAVPFYGLELLFGFVQALIFAGLTLVFATIAVTPREAE